jgi:hypothetical protein
MDSSSPRRSIWPHSGLGEGTSGQILQPFGRPAGKGTLRYLRLLPQCYDEDKAVGMHGPSGFALLRYLSVTVTVLWDKT